MAANDDLIYQYFRSNGFSGTLQDMEKQFYLLGGPAMYTRDASGNITGLLGGPPLRPNQLVGSIVGGGGTVLPANTNSVESGGSTKTYGFAFGAWGPFNAVQFLYANHTTASYTVDNAIAAASATAYPSGVFNIAAPSSGWSTATGPVVVPASSGSDASQRARLPGYALSPKMQVRSIPRAAGELDGGNTELVFGRILHLSGNATATYGDMGANFATIYDPINEGFSALVASLVFGDGVTTPGSVTTSTREATPGVALAGIVFSYDQKMTVVGGPGDSTYVGTSDVSAAFGVPYLFKTAARIKRDGKKIAYLNNGIAGSSMQQINIRGKQLVDLNALDIMVLQSHTTNNAITGGPNGTAADYDAQWFYVQDLAQYHLNKKNGNQVFLMTPLPFNAITGASNILRLKQRDRVIASGMPYVDLESLADSTGKWANAAHAPDGTHPSQLGHTAISALVYPALKTLIP